VIYAEEDDTYKDKDELINEFRPLPQGLGGELPYVMFAAIRWKRSSQRGCR
jgi:hypothetical protein